MMKLFGKAKQPLQAGLSIRDDNLAVALIKRDRSNRPQLLEAASLSVSPGSHVEEALESIKKQFRLHKIPCVYVMEPSSYSLLQVESPNVKADEMKSALRWKIKDMIDFHVDDATIDLFEIPATALPGSTKMLEVVVARTALIQRRVDMLHAANIEPRAIDITELALRNVSLACIQGESTTHAAMYLLPQNVYIEIADCNSLYLCRNIETSLAQLTPVDGGGSNWAESSHEVLSLEMQRTMDYYESQYGKGPASEMRIFQKIDNHDDFVNFARQQLSFKINTDSIHDSIPGIEQLEEDMLPNCLPAIGAALRAA